MGIPTITKRCTTEATIDSNTNGVLSVSVAVDPDAHLEKENNAPGAQRQHSVGGVYATYAPSINLNLQSIHNQDMIGMRTDQVPSNCEAGVTPISMHAVYY